MLSNLLTFIINRSIKNNELSQIMPNVVWHNALIFFMPNSFQKCQIGIKMQKTGSPAVNTLKLLNSAVFSHLFLFVCVYCILYETKLNIIVWC